MVVLCSRFCEGCPEEEVRVRPSPTVILREVSAVGPGAKSLSRNEYASAR